MRIVDDAGLTVAAGLALDEHLDDLRRRVVREASRGVHGSVNTIHTRAAIARLALADRILPHSVFDLVSMLSRPPYAAAFLGGTLTVALTATTAIMTTAELAVTPMSGALVGALLGTTTTVLTCLMLGMRQTASARGKVARAEVAADFLSRLDRLERMAVTASGHRLSLRATMNTLMEQDIWTKEDVLSFARLLRVRNALIHEAVTPAQTDLLAMLLEIDRLTEEVS